MHLFNEEGVFLLTTYQLEVNFKERTKASAHRQWRHLHAARTPLWCPWFSILCWYVVDVSVTQYRSDHMLGTYYVVCWPRIMCMISLCRVYVDMWLTTNREASTLSALKSRNHSFAGVEGIVVIVYFDGIAHSFQKKCKNISSQIPIAIEHPYDGRVVPETTPARTDFTASDRALSSFRGQVRWKM